MKEIKKNQKIKDIRINKKNFKNNIMELSFFKINFLFFSNILKKYKNNKYVESLISQKIPLVFLIKSENNESILKSVSDILELLKNYSETKNHDKILDEKSDVNINKITQDNNKSYPENIQNKIITNKNYSADLTYNYEKKDEKILQVLESIIFNIKKNLKLNNKTSNLLTNQKQNSKNKQEIKLPKESDQKLKNTKTSSELAKSEKEIKSQKKSKQKNQKNNNLNLSENKTKQEELEENQQVFKTISLKKITSQFKKINEKIIKRNIQKAKISKINYDFISKDRILSKNIYNKINNTIFSIINKNNKIKHFSEASKNFVLLNKKFKTQNIIKEFQDIITKNKINQKKISSNISSSRFNQKKYFENNLIYKNNFRHKKFITSSDFIYSNILKNSNNFIDYKNKITKSINFIDYNNKISNSTSYFDYKNKIAKNLEKFYKFKQNKYFTKKDIIISDNFIHKINKTKILSDKFKTHSNYSEFNLNKINFVEHEKNIKKHENLFSNTQIIYRQKTNIENIVKNIINKQQKEKNNINLQKKVYKEFQNNKNFEFLKNIHKKSQIEKKSEISKDEVKKIIKNYIESINFKKISDNAVLQVENKINLERYRNGII